MQDFYNAANWLIDRHVEAGDGDRIAIESGDEKYSYADVQKELFRVQHALAVLQVRQEDRVALVLNDEPAFPAWFLGSMRSGIVPIPLSTMLNGDELGFVIDDSRAAVVVMSAAYAKSLPTIRSIATDLKRAVIVGNVDDETRKLIYGELEMGVYLWADFDDIGEAPTAKTGADSPGFWLYSSGTTGSPKGVMHRQKALEVTAVNYGTSVIKIQPEDRCLSAAKLFFAFGLGNSLTFPFSVGATSILNPAWATPKSVAEALERYRPTIFYGSPGLLASIMDNEVSPEVMSSLRLVVVSGEALPAEIHRRFTELYKVPVLDGVGSTEALHMFMCNRVGEEHPGTSGRPVDGYDVKLIDGDGLEVTSPESPGYLHIRGDSIATGYWCRYESAKKAFIGEWLRTGDVYTRTQDGYYHFLGRDNDMIKIGGIWVSPAEVESILTEHADVLEAAVVGARTITGLETAVAFVVPRSGKIIDAASLELHCRSRMAAFKRPREIFFVEELPKTATGKVKRFQLRQQISERVSAK
ncbi:MAG: benzoate-CoA ligase family protein [Acidimicrobiaceae bacterium]|nr:benzoate-CoA ligase family protein [Acidimicrobiaceae bacterium]